MRTKKKPIKKKRLFPEKLNLDLIPDYNGLCRIDLGTKCYVERFMIDNAISTLYFKQTLDDDCNSLEKLAVFVLVQMYRNQVEDFKL